MSKETETEATVAVKEKHPKHPTALLLVICVFTAITFLNSVVFMVLMVLAVYKYTGPIYDPYPYPCPYPYDQPCYESYSTAEPAIPDASTAESGEASAASPTTTR